MGHGGAVSLDTHLAGAFRAPVWITCQRCGLEFSGTHSGEGGQGVLEPEECPACFSTDLEVESE